MACVVKHTGGLRPEGSTHTALTLYHIPVSIPPPLNFGRCRTSEAPSGRSESNRSLSYQSSASEQNRTALLVAREGVEPSTIPPYRAPELKAASAIPPSRIIIPTSLHPTHTGSVCQLTLHHSPVSLVGICVPSTILSIGYTCGGAWRHRTTAAFPLASD